MAAVEQRLGWVRRGATPAAPKPINLPSQKYENYRLVPDVEIVPRGTCCWGSAGRSIPASGDSNDKTDSESPPLGDNDTEDDGSKVPNDSVLFDEVQSPSEKSDEAHSVESSTSRASSTACTPSAEACNAFSNLGVGVGNISAKDGSDFLAASDADSFLENVARPSSSESYSSSSVSPTTRVEEQKHSGFPQVCRGDYEKVSTAQAKKETHVGNDSLPGSQDFGYFEGSYNTQASFSRTGAPYPNSPRMAFGPGMHPGPPHHYSFLGVPYYDSVKDKEIVVITMVGSPGVYGSYLPHPGFLNQLGRPSVYGNLPLQFGHFERCVGPQVSAEMNPMCSGEDSGYMCYAQENYKQGWENGSSVGIGQRDNGVHFPTSLSTFKVNPRSDDCIMPKRMGRHKAVNRNRRPIREASPMVERRVTLLTKVSQHEVIISNVQRKSKHGGARRAKNTYSPHVFPEDVLEVAHNSMAIPVCASQPNGAILPVEASAGDMVQGQSGASHSTTDCTALESTDTATVGKVVNVEERCFLDLPEKVSGGHGLSLPQAACRASDNEVPISEPRCQENAKAAVFEPFLASESIPLPMSISTFIPISDAQVSIEWPAHHGSPPTCPPKIEVPGSSVETFNVCADDIRFKSEVRCVSKVGEIWLDDPCNNLTECAASVEPAFECTDVKESLSVSSSACLPNEPTEESPGKPLAQTGNERWRRKGSVDATKLRIGDFSQKVQDSSVNKRASRGDQLNDLKEGMHTSSGSGSGSLLSSPSKTNPVSESGLSACYGDSAALSSFDESTACSRAMVPSVSTQDQLCKDKSSKDFEAGSASTGGSECAAQVLDSSRKTLSVAGGQSLPSRSVSCGAGKMWRPKLSGAAGGHEISVTKDSGIKPGKVYAAPSVSRLQAKDNGPVSESNHTLEVLSEENHMKHMKVNMQDEGCNKLANMASLVAKVPCNYHGGERSTQQPSHSVESVEDVQSAGEKKLSQSVQKQQRAEELHSTHANETLLESSRSVEVEFISRKNSFPRNIHLGKQGNNAWRVAAKHVPMQKPTLASNLESEHNDSAAKSKELLAGKQGVSWKPRQSCTANKGLFNGVKDDNASNLALQNEICAEGKEQGNRRPFSMKNFSNDDNRKAPQLHSSVHMEHGMVRENMCTVGTGRGKSNPSSRTTYMKVGRCGESHFAKKVDRKGWVVKSETARSSKA